MSEMTVTNYSLQTAEQGGKGSYTDLYGSIVVGHLGGHYVVIDATGSYMMALGNEVDVDWSDGIDPLDKRSKEEEGRMNDDLSNWKIYKKFSWWWIAAPVRNGVAGGALPFKTFDDARKTFAFNKHDPF